MPRLHAFVGVLAVAPAAHAQTVAITWSSSEPVLSPDNPTTTVRLTADWGNDDWSFCTTVFDALAEGASGGVVGQRFMNGIEGFFVSEGTVTDDNSILGVEPFCFPPAFGGGAWNPLEVWFTYTATDFTPRTVSYTSEHTIFLVYTDDFGTTIELDWEVEGTSFAVVPGAPTAILVVFAPLARRRR